MNEPLVLPPFFDAPWPDAPRLVPDCPLPPYRFVPGYSHHPVTHMSGHRYGLAGPEAAPLEKPWQDDTPYLFGFDLYHAGFYWEAHEYWEVVWKVPGRAPDERAVLQALILQSAAQLKAITGNTRGLGLLSAKAFQRLAPLEAARVRGVALAPFRDALRLQTPLNPPLPPARFALE